MPDKFFETAGFVKLPGGLLFLLLSGKKASYSGQVLRTNRLLVVGNMKPMTDLPYI
ncbi:MAG: hypothetical protein IPM47_04800 [Sphingobacteriales bacterium]|nr:MAG: hypothetical protein IPM47_04800 [Sphingobacteriales bacterium]